MNETFLLTIAGYGQAGNDLLIFPAMPADKYHFADLEKIRIVTPYNRGMERDAEFGIPFETPSVVYMLLIRNTQKDEVPVGSQLWVLKPLDQIERSP